MTTVTHIYPGVGNRVYWTLYAAGQALSQASMGDITRVVLSVDDGDTPTQFDTDVSPGVLSWDTLVQSLDGEDEYPIQGVGTELGLERGNYRDCTLTVYSAEWPNGKTWPEPFAIIVHR